jgi:hypothetical protein
MRLLNMFVPCWWADGSRAGHPELLARKDGRWQIRVTVAGQRDASLFTHVCRLAKKVADVKEKGPVKQDFTSPATELLDTRPLPGRYPRAITYMAMLKMLLNTVPVPLALTPTTR